MVEDQDILHAKEVFYYRTIPLAQENLNLLSLKGRGGEQE